MTGADLYDVAVTIAHEARDLVVAGRSSAAVTATKSAAIDVVTQMDIAAENHLRSRLLELRPGDGVLGEEGEDVHSDTGITWVIDPIDGTVNYLYGIEHFAVSVAAVQGRPTPHAWEPVAGVVCTGSGDTYAARAGQGATKNGRTLDGSHPVDLSQTLVATGFQYIAERRIEQAKVLTEVIRHVRDIRRLGSASVDLCLVAEGVIDAYYEHGLNAWDFAAGALIAREAGVTVAGHQGGPADESLTIAAPAHIWQDLHDAVVAAGGARLW